MKRLAQHIILLITAITLLFTGGGVTVIHYCCATSTPDLILLGVEKSCCENNSDTEKCACHTDDKSNGEDCNHTERYAFDLNILKGNIKAFSSLEWIQHSHFDNCSSCSIKTLANLASTDSEDKAPPIIPPRNYLAKIRILII